VKLLDKKFRATTEICPVR